MSFHPRRRRPDDWTTSHARARADLSDRLDGVLDPGEAGWLDEHLAGCAECRAAAAEYEADRDALRSLRDLRPVPPRDLWARTAAAIEHESRFRDHPYTGRARRPLLGSTVLAAALVVVVAAGVLTSSRLFVDGDHATPSPGTNVANASGAAASDVAVIPISQKVTYLGRTADGRLALKTIEISVVCPNAGDSCSPGAPSEDQPVQFTSDPQSLFGAPGGKSMIVVGEGPQPSSNSIAVVAIEPTESAAASPSKSPTVAPASPEVSPTPSTTPTPTATPVATPSSGPASVAPSAPASRAPSGSPSAAANSSEPPPSSTEPTSSSQPTPSTAPTPSGVTITPSPSAPGAIEIARDVVLVGQSAAYSPSGAWFAFTARPTDGSAGPDIYVWKVGDPTATPVTSDHRSTFGSWIGDDMMVGSTVVDPAGGKAASPAPSDAANPAPSDAASPAGGGRTAVSFLLNPRDGTQIALPQTGRTWRPSVDPTGRRAVYWTGTLRRSDNVPADVPDAGRLVVGDWATGDAPSGSPLATPPGDQPTDRHESTIAEGRIPDWDARWDPTGTKLAVWIADRNDPRVGMLSLYDVASFDAQVDLRKPILDARPATAGFSISNGKLVWADPSADGSGGKGRILVLAWTDQGIGTVETLPDDVVVIR
jgi:hypothetical protein